MNLLNFRTVTLTLLLLSGAATQHTHAMGAAARKACLLALGHSKMLVKIPLLARWGGAFVGDACIAKGLQSHKSRQQETHAINTNTIQRKWHNSLLLFGGALSTLMRVSMVKHAGLHGLTVATMSIPTDYGVLKGANKFWPKRNSTNS